MRRLLICLLLVSFCPASHAEDMKAAVDAMIREKIAETNKKYEQSKKQAGQQERIVFPKASYDAGMAFLRHLLKSEDTELKRLYMLSVYTPELEWEKGNAEYAEDEEEKRRIQEEIGRLKGRIAKLKQS